MPHSKHVTLSGTVEHVFAHRFVLRATDGVHLVDLTPEGRDDVDLAPGLALEVEGEQKPSEVKALRVTVGGRDIPIRHKHGPGRPRPHGHGHDHPHDPAAALDSVRAQGFEPLAPPLGKPKHFEVLARRADGGVFELHVEHDGRIRNQKPAQAGAGKWAGAAE